MTLQLLTKRSAPRCISRLSVLCCLAYAWQAIDALQMKEQINSRMQVSSQQLRDDLMTLLIAGHETTAAVLTWTLHCLVDHPDYMQELQQEASLTFNLGK